MKKHEKQTHAVTLILFLIFFIIVFAFLLLSINAFFQDTNPLNKVIYGAVMLILMIILAFLFLNKDNAKLLVRINASLGKVMEKVLEEND